MTQKQIEKLRKKVWIKAYTAALTSGNIKFVSTAISMADEALEAFEKRFINQQPQTDTSAHQMD